MKKIKSSKKLTLTLITFAAIGFIVILFLVGMLLLNKSPQTQVTNQESAAPEQTKVLLIELKAQNNSGQEGTVQLENIAGGKTKVKINLIGKNPRVPQPAHIHTGVCPKPGAVKYPLNNVISNTSETILDLSIDSLVATGPFAINVHKSASESAVYTSCGDIPKS